MLAPLFLQPTETGMLPGLRAAIDHLVRGGESCGPLGRTETRGPPGRVRSGSSARGPWVRHRLWDEFERLTGVRYVF